MGACGDEVSAKRPSPAAVQRLVTHNSTRRWPETWDTYGRCLGAVGAKLPKVTNYPLLRTLGYSQTSRKKGVPDVKTRIPAP